LTILAQNSRQPVLNRLRRAASARHRFYRRKYHAAKKQVSVRARLFLLKTQNQTQLAARATVTRGSKWIATAAGTAAAGLFALTLPDTKLQQPSFRVSEVHIGCSAIIGTALALVLSLSIVPAQKAADFFSSAILRLYARGRTTLRVFALLSCSALLSVLFGTGWTFSVSSRYTLAGQFILQGASLDALRAFYIRALHLLDPATALRETLRNPGYRRFGGGRGAVSGAARRLERL
jgi:hypothetical protein